MSAKAGGLPSPWPPFDRANILTNDMFIVGGPLLGVLGEPMSWVVPSSL